MCHLKLRAILTPSTFCPSVWLLASFGIAACQTAEPPQYQEIDAKDSAVRFEHPDFDPDLSKHKRYTRSRTGSRLDVAYLYGSNVDGVIVAEAAGPGYVFDERSLERRVSQVLVDDAQIVWGTRGSAVSGIGYTPYRFFQVTNYDLESCVGFYQSAGETQDDNRRRKSDLLYGYFCRDKPQPMTLDDAEELIGRVKVGR